MEKETAHYFYLAVVGAGKASPEIYEQARQVGKLAALRGWIVLTGGLAGVMEAAAKGAREAGGLSLGILPGGDRKDANPFIDLAVVTHMHHARNSVIVHTADVIIAVGGEYGTLSEIALGLKMGKPVIGLGTDWEVKGLRASGTPEEAISLASEMGRKRYRSFKG
jgi:hypothetical protein